MFRFDFRSMRSVRRDNGAFGRGRFSFSELGTDGIIGNGSGKTGIVATRVSRAAFPEMAFVLAMALPHAPRVRARQMKLIQPPRGSSRAILPNYPEGMRRGAE